MLFLILTFDRQLDGVALAGAVAVGGGAEVLPGALPGHALQRQRLVHGDHAAVHVVLEGNALEGRKGKRIN